jgi:hypothetical protein
MKSNNKKSSVLPKFKRTVLIGKVPSSKISISSNSQEELETSKIKFGFFENDDELKWKNTSLSKQESLAIRAYSKYAY